MPSIIGDVDQEKLRRPHIQRAWFGGFDFPDGIKYLHDGTGKTTPIGGHEYLGISSPLDGRLVKISGLEEPRFGQAAAVAITLTGVNKAFVKEVFDDARDIEGRDADLSWGMFDPETQELMFANLIPLFPRGRMSSPRINLQGLGGRFVSLTIENIWASQNFAPGGKWNDADQQARYPGDLGLNQVDVNVTEDWR